MNPEQLAREQMEIEKERMINDRMQIARSNREIIPEYQDTSMIKEQLDLGEELERIDYLLRGYVLEDGQWVEPKDSSLVVFSDYGVHLVRNTIAWYINKNTLLSNYDDKTILEKMYDFSNDLNDTIFMEYEKVFQYPTIEECKEELQKRITKKAEMTQYSLQLQGIEKSLEEIKKDKIREIEDRIEDELTKIKEQIIKNKLKRFLIIMRTIQDTIHSTYLRAWKGQERSSLRRHMTVTENKGFSPMQQQNQGGFGIFGRKR